MHRFTATILAALLCFGAIAAHGAPLLLISIDGLHPDYVIHADRHGLEIPTLRRLMSTGSHASGVVGVVPTVTYPSHTTMVTGVAPAKHGIYSNTTFDPTGANRDGWYWYAEDIKAPTLWAAASQAKLRTASINWPVTVADRNIQFLFPEYWRTSTADDAKLLRALAKPQGIIERYEAQLGTFVDGNTDTLESDRVRTRFAVKLIREEKPDFIAVHLIALDGIEHRDGPFVASSFATLEALDGMIEELQRTALAANPATVTAIVSDHGFQATHTAVNLRVPFVDHGLIKLKPARSHVSPAIDSWDAQVWPGGAVAAVVLKNRDDPAVRERVQELLAQLRREQRDAIARIEPREALSKLGGFPEADWLIEFAPGFYFGGDLRGPLLTPGGSKGTHGYMPERPQMHASLFIAGERIKRGGLGVVGMRQLAPTFARILGVRFESEQPALDVIE
jgi:predicted AlkP superfamily pyrophosphatase or phosphodiesterase